jgi:SAM-dependent methyltransferase
MTDTTSKSLSAGTIEGAPVCPLCGGSGRPHFQAGEHRFYKCGNCHSGFVAPTPDDEFLTTFYSRYHLSFSDGGGYELREARMEADFPAKADLVRVIAGNESMRLLDVGCGKGFFVKACRDTGIDAVGIDLSDNAIRHATEVLQVPAYCGLIEDMTEELGQFDAVTLWATIEHLPRPIETLKAIRNVLKPGGVIFADTGIADDLLERSLPGVTQWYDPPQHLFVFSEAGMRAAMKAAGFDVIHVDRCFERSTLRRYARMVRAGATSLGLKAVMAIFRIKRPLPFEFTRYPLGNLILCAARRIDEDHSK